MVQFISLGWKLFCVMIAFNMVNMMNQCYEKGNAIDYCIGSGSGHNKPLWHASYTPLLGYGFTDANNKYVNLSDRNLSTNGFNQTIVSAVEYRPAPAGITDIFGFFSWVVTGMRLITNIFITPFYDLPMWVSNNFGILPIFTVPIGSAIGVIQIVGLFQWATTRPGVGR